LTTGPNGSCKTFSFTPKFTEVARKLEMMHPILLVHESRLRKLGLAQENNNNITVEEITSKDTYWCGEEHWQQRKAVQQEQRRRMVFRLFIGEWVWQLKILWSTRHYKSIWKSANPNTTPKTNKSKSILRKDSKDMPSSIRDG
jgi:hypothetical protein